MFSDFICLFAFLYMIQYRNDIEKCVYGSVLQSSLHFVVVAHFMPNRMAFREINFSFVCFLFRSHWIFFFFTGKFQHNMKIHSLRTHLCECGCSSISSTVLAVEYVHIRVLQQQHSKQIHSILLIQFDHSHVSVSGEFNVFLAFTILLFWNCFTWNLQLFPFSVFNFF